MYGDFDWASTFLQTSSFRFARPPRSLMASANQALQLHCLICTKSPLAESLVIAPPRKRCRHGLAGPTHVCNFSNGNIHSAKPAEAFSANALAPPCIFPRRPPQKSPPTASPQFPAYQTGIPRQPPPVIGGSDAGVERINYGKKKPFIPGR